jgi:hypothetical protein
VPVASLILICGITPETARRLIGPEVLVELPNAPEEEESEEDNNLAIWLKHFPEGVF